MLAAQALKELANRTGANIVLDVRTKEKGKSPINANLQQVPLETAVRMLADMADLKAIVLDNALYVTTEENAKKLVKEHRERASGAVMTVDAEGHK